MLTREGSNGPERQTMAGWVCARCGCAVETSVKVHYDEARCECPPEGEDPYHVDNLIIGTAFKLSVCIVLALVLAPLLSSCGRHHDDGFGQIYKPLACQYGTDKCPTR